MVALSGVVCLAATSARAAGIDGQVHPLADDVDAAATANGPRRDEAELSKRDAWLREKANRKDVHLSDAEIARPGALADAAPPAGYCPTRTAGMAPGTIVGGRPRGGELTLPPPGTRIAPVTTLFNVWTREALPLLPGPLPSLRLHPFLRDHHTNQATHMDTRLLDVLAAAGERFAARRIEVVSGYRSPKYNLMLRKKGHQVARSSQHVEGQAVDFRIRGVPTKSLLQFVRSLRRGGVGFYPHSQFVHSDTGPIRFWKGT